MITSQCRETRRIQGNEMTAERSGDHANVRFPLPLIHLLVVLAVCSNTGHRGDATVFPSNNGSKAVRQVVDLSMQLPVPVQQGIGRLLAVPGALGA